MQKKAHKEQNKKNYYNFNKIKRTITIITKCNLFNNKNISNL